MAHGVPGIHVCHGLQRQAMALGFALDVGGKGLFHHPAARTLKPRRQFVHLLRQRDKQESDHHSGVCCSHESLPMTLNQVGPALGSCPSAVGFLCIRHRRRA